MAAGDILLGLIGSEVLLPSTGRKVNEEDIELITESRTINGTLVSDLIAVKKKFSITFDPGLDDEELSTLLTLYSTHDDLNMIIHNRNSSTRNYTVVLRPIPRIREDIVEDWHYIGVSLVLEEV